MASAFLARLYFYLLLSLFKLDVVLPAKWGIDVSGRRRRNLGTAPELGTRSRQVGTEARKRESIDKETEKRKEKIERRKLSEEREERRQEGGRAREERLELELTELLTKEEEEESKKEEATHCRQRAFFACPRTFSLVSLDSGMVTGVVEASEVFSRPYYYWVRRYVWATREESREASFPARSF